MNALATDAPPEQALHDWVLRNSGDALLARAAACAARAERAGHACAWLAEEGFDAAQMDALRAAPWVAAQPDAAPFVLDAAGRFYVRRNAAAEQEVAAHIAQRAAPAPASVGNHAALLAELLPGAASGEQRAALAQAFGRRLFVLGGAPGTGKTTSLLALLLALLRLGADAGLPAAPRIALAAPTGKAAARLTQALRDGLARLHAQLADTAWQPALAAAGALSAGTLHRLLGRRLQGVAAPLAADVVAVDEASMIDLGLMRTLLQSLRPDTVLILLGDPDQLASVEAGSVLADIVAAAPDTPLQGCVARLAHSHRAQAGFTRLLDAVRAGDAAPLHAASARAAAPLHLRTVAAAPALRAALHDWLERHADRYAGLLRPGLTPEHALAQLRRAQLLCALRVGPFGQVALNAAIEAWLRQRHALPEGFWFAGRVVMVTRNDARTGLANGDVGVVLADRDGPRVWFEAAGADAAGVPRAFAPPLLPPHEPAWAITIHKAQGSEYDAVATLLPADADSPILSRELVYTALSRARRHAELWCTEAALAAALARPIRRAGGLRERLLAAARQAAFQ